MHLVRCRRFTSIAFSALMLAGCAGSMSGAPRATAELAPTRGNTAAGTVTLTQQGDNIVFATQIRGLKPNQEHGFHVHEKGDCSSPDALSAGGHLNPAKHVHGPQSLEHHAGDLPALKADADGVAKMSFTVPGTLSGAGAADFAGKALVVHADRDDYLTQPTGNSGARIACGVIAMAK